MIIGYLVHLAPNIHGTEEGSVFCTKNDGSNISVNCLSIIKSFNLRMDGVDKVDQLRALFNVNRKCKTWWHRLFWDLLGIACCVNNFVVNNKLNDTK